MRSSAAGRNWPSASYSRCDVSRSSNASSGLRWISSRSATSRRWTSTGTRRSGSNTVNLVRGQRFATDGEVVHPVHVHCDPQPLPIAWYLDGAGPIHRPFRRYDVPFPVAGARADISRNGEVGKRGEGDVVRAANTALQHPAAPDRHTVPRAQVVDRDRSGEAAYSTRLDIDDASCREGDHVLRALEAGDGFVEADGRRQAPLQRRMPYEIVPGERLLDHQEPELVELHEAIAVVERVGIVRVRHERRGRTERLPSRPDVVDIRAGLDLDLHLVIGLRQRLACFRDQRLGRGLDAERDPDWNALARAADESGQWDACGFRREAPGAISRVAFAIQWPRKSCSRIAWTSRGCAIARPSRRGATQAEMASHAVSIVSGE